MVIVTGAAAGIGKATARRFLQEGCRVASWDIASWDGKDGENADAEYFQKVDVTNAAAVEAAVDEVVRRWGGLHVLVNNAGILRDGQLVKSRTANWRAR